MCGMGGKATHGFSKLKDKISQESVSNVPDLYCDASGKCVGAVVDQVGHAVVVKSRQLGNAKVHASIFKKELMVVIYTLLIWKHCLVEADCDVKMDHQNFKVSSHSS